ncbi:MAG: TM0996/MTH895 family glutaredoxin-like protein [Anaerolineaceae bacterium]|nr:TM0996/MTH895 family glutaredoxin-like protein [Anaerolineaceae bacterium]
MIEIKVLGPGCVNCKRLEQIARKVIGTLAINANLVKVTNYKEIVDLGVLSTPGLIVNDRIVSSGRIPSEAEISDWLTDALEAA